MKLSTAGAAALPMFSENPVVGDVVAATITAGIVHSTYRFLAEIVKLWLLDQKLSRKLMHMSVGPVFMLCWPMFSPGYRGATLAALLPGAVVIGMLLLRFGIWKDEAILKRVRRFGDQRDLLDRSLAYGTTLTLSSACAIYWRTTPIAIVAICNLCVGDGVAAIVGRRFGSKKLPYNINKSVAGSVSMAFAAFLVSVGYMHYFSLFGYVEESWEIVCKFLFVSVAAALVESHPLSTQLDDNVTVVLASVFMGTFIF